MDVNAALAACTVPAGIRKTMRCTGKRRPSGTEIVAVLNAVLPAILASGDVDMAVTAESNRLAAKPWTRLAHGITP